jgi:hypothetical protein
MECSLQFPNLNHLSELFQVHCSIKFLCSKYIQQFLGLFVILNVYVSYIKVYSLYSDWLFAGRQRGHSSSSGKGKNFLVSAPSRPVPGPTKPPTQWVPGSVSPGVKRPGREADHSPPTSADVKNT